MRVGSLVIELDRELRPLALRGSFLTPKQPGHGSDSRQVLLRLSGRYQPLYSTTAADSGALIMIGN
jgi:hypothetical protein